MTIPIQTLLNIAEKVGAEVYENYNGSGDLYETSVEFESEKLLERFAFLVAKEQQLETLTAIIDEFGPAIDQAGQLYKLSLMVKKIREEIEADEMWAVLNQR